MTARLSTDVEWSAIDFPHNMAVHAKLMGRPPEQTDLIAAVLKIDGKPDHLLKAQPGSFISSEFILWLADGRMTTKVEGEKYKAALKFCEPLFDEPGHPLVEYIRQGEFTIELLVLKKTIEDIEGAFARMANFGPKAQLGGSSVERVLRALDLGLIRVAEMTQVSPDSEVVDGWRTYGWIKKVLLLRLLKWPSVVTTDRLGFTSVPSKFEGWGDLDWQASGLVVGTGSVVCQSAYIASGAKIEPLSFIDAGVHIEAGASIGVGARIGLGAQIGKDCHIGAGVTIEATMSFDDRHPAIVEEGCHIGAQCYIGAGVLVGEGATLKPGVVIESNTSVHELHGSLGIGPKIFCGEVPSNAEVAMGTHPKHGTLIPVIERYRS